MHINNSSISMACDEKSCGFYDKMNGSVGAGNALPIDVALKIVSSLQVLDVCSLGCCSVYWQEVCGSDTVWESLSRERWPNADLDKEFAAYQSQDRELNQPTDANTKGWRGFYVKKHEEMADKVTLISTFMERNSSLESIDVQHYQKAIEDMNSAHFTFDDVKLLLFKPNLSVLLNLVGLHYCTMQLDVPADVSMKTLTECKIEERRISVQWKKLRRRLGIFRLHDNLDCVNISLGDLATAKGGVLFLIQRGVFNEWLRIQISAA